MNRILFVLAAAVLMAPILGCGSSSGAASGDPQRLVGKPSAKPLPPEYRILAEHLAVEVRPSPDQYRDDIGTEEILAAGHSAVLALRGIQSSDSDLNYIANLGQAALSDAVMRLERINALPKPPSDGEVMVSSFMAGFLSGDMVSGAMAGGAIGYDADQKRNAVATEVHGLIAALEAGDATHLMLPKIAEKYSASQSSSTGRFLVNIDESWGGFGPNDWFCINNSGPDLDDCTIQVQLTGAAGEVRKNVHFVRHWPANTWMYARYEPGQEVFGRQAGKKTVTQIQQADISVWSPAFSTALTYTYQGAEKDEDIAQRCSTLKFTGRYEPFQEGILWNTHRGCYFTLTGFPYLPGCRADVTFKGGSQSKEWYWELDNWKDGEEKHFGTSEGQLLFDPETIDLSLSFPDSSYKHKVTLTVKK